MKIKCKIEKYINFSLISNCIIFNTLAGSGKSKEQNKTGSSKGCCGSGKDKKTTITNQVSSQEEIDKRKTDEEEKKRKQEELEKEQQKLEEQEELRKNIDILKNKFYDLKSNYDKLDKSKKHYFKIDCFIINITEEEITGSTNENIHNLKKKLNIEVNNFKNTLEAQFKILKDKFEELEKKDKSDADYKFNTSFIGNILQNDVTVDSFINLDNNLYLYETALTGDLDKFKNSVKDTFTTEGIKNLFTLANKIESSFNIDLEAKIKCLDALDSFKKVQNLQNEINKSLEDCNDIIKYKKKELDDEIENANNAAVKINDTLFLTKLKIELEKISVIYQLTNVKEYEKITKDLNDLKTKIAEIQTDIKNFLDVNFVTDLLKETGWNFIEKAEKFADFINFYKNINGGEFYDLKINYYDIDDLKNRINKKLEDDDNIFIVLSEEEKGGNEYSYVFYKYSNDILNFKEKIENTNAIEKKYVDSVKCKLSFFIDINSNDIDKILFKKNFINEKKNNSEIIFLLSNDTKSYIFYSQSKNKSIGNLITKEDIKKSIKKLKILYNSDNFESMEYMFFCFKNLEQLYINNFNTGNVTNMSGMFYGCEALKELNLANFNTGNVTDMNSMFSGCSSLTNLNLANFNTGNVTDMNSMFSGCSSLTNLNLSNFNTQNVTNMSMMFYECEALKELNLSNFNTQNVTNMRAMFSNCKKLEQLNLTNFNTQNITNMSEMFYKCEALKELNLSNFNTQNVTNMSNMFRYCSSLINLNLTNFNTEKVTDMSSMFSGCSSLINLNLTNFNTEKVTDMSYTFCYCSALTNLDLSNFNTKNVTNMSNMFSGCSALTNLDLSNFNTQNITNMSEMFYKCEALENPKCSDNFVANGDFNDIFIGCNKIDNFFRGKFKKKD